MEASIAFKTLLETRNLKQFSPSIIKLRCSCYTYVYESVLGEIKMKSYEHQQTTSLNDSRWKNRTKFVSGHLVTTCSKPHIHTIQEVALIVTMRNNKEMLEDPVKVVLQIIQSIRA